MRLYPFKQFILMFLLFINLAFANIVEYEFDIAYSDVNYTGKTVKAMTIDYAIPGPTIKATVGDTLRVTFNNKMDVETSVHWHGVLLPNDQDGVPYLTTPPIKAGTSFTYEFPILHSGTYWYHSHTGLQEQRGVYGSLVFHPDTAERYQSDRDYVVVFSDWIDESPEQVMANLKKDDDYYALKKGSVQSWLKVLQHGSDAIKARLQGAWSRMGTMDVSDIGYDAFLANGQQQENLDATSGEQVRLRIINASASSYFNVEFAGGAMSIIAADGVDVEPVDVQRFSIAIAETYDVLVTLPDDKAYELRATANDGTGYASAILGTGEVIEASTIPRPNLFVSHLGMDHDMDMKMDHSSHPMSNQSLMPQQNVISYMTGYDALRSLINTALPQNNPMREVVLELTGNMERYVWSFNNKTLSEADLIKIKQGENVRFILENKTMMDHPIHLHGHFFRVLNGQGDYSPLKHTVDVPAMQTIIIEFEANEEKDWFFHCHNLYHMKAGMARIVSYEGSTQANKNTIARLAGDRQWYVANDIAAYSNMTLGTLRTFNTRNAFEIEFDYDYDRVYDIEAIYQRNFTRFFDAYTGVNLEREEKNDPSETTAIAGIRYVLPLLIDTDLRINSKGKLRLQLSSELQLTDRTQFEWQLNTDKEYQLILSYALNKKLLLSAIYDSDQKAGIGLRLKL